jgi:tetratricopeptide (TPR) repeat protein
VTSVNIQWDLLRRGFFEQGLTLMQESLNEDPNPSALVTLGLGYLWAGKYEETRKLFQDWMDKYQITSEIYFAMIGAAQWCLDDYVPASESWKLGLHAQRIDMAGGIESPLFLWIASVLRPNDKLRREAVKILEKKVKSDKVRHWPGPLAQFILGQIDERTLYERSIIRLSANRRLIGKTPPRREWTIVFYKHVRELERGGLSSNDFQKEMRELVDTSSPTWSEEEDFLQLVRNPEFYIARHESIPV